MKKTIRIFIVTILLVGASGVFGGYADASKHGGLSVPSDQVEK